MEVAKTLIRSVVRAFYDTKHVLVIDAVLIHSAIPYDDLSFLLGMQTKDLRKLCGILKENRLLSVQSRPEAREGMQRPINKEYCFVDFHATIDAIKYKVYHLTEKVKQLYKPTQEKKDYFCPKCEAQWTQLEVLDKVGPLGFECHRCGHILERAELNEGDVTGHEKQTRLMQQIDGFIQMLQGIDAQDVPNNDFDTAMSLRVVVERERGNNITMPVTDLSGKQGVSAGVVPTIVPLDVSVISNTETTAAEKAEEAKRKADVVAQNALPVWHTTSTVSGERTVAAQSNGEPQSTSLIKDEEEDHKGENVLDDELRAYYEQLENEKQREAQEDQEAEEESGDDDAFEDALGAEASQISTPAMSFDVGTNDKGPGSESNGTPADDATLKNGKGLSDDSPDEPASKRVKFGGTNGITNGNSGDTPAGKTSDEDEDEDVEFEDV